MVANWSARIHQATAKRSLSGTTWSSSGQYGWWPVAQLSARCRRTEKSQPGCWSCSGNIVTKISQNGRWLLSDPSAINVRMQRSKEVVHAATANLLATRISRNCWWVLGDWSQSSCNILVKWSAHGRKMITSNFFCLVLQFAMEGISYINLKYIVLVMLNLAGLYLRRVDKWDRIL